MLDQPLGEAFELCEPHEGDERPRRGGERGCVETLGVVRGERGHRRRDAAVGDGNAGGSGHGCERGHARDHLERHTGAGERERLLPATSEQERVAALQPDDVERVAVVNEELVHLLLREPVALHAARPRRRLVDELRSDEPVVDQNVTRAHACEALHSDEPRIPGSRADERDAHESALATTSRK